MFVLNLSGLHKHLLDRFKMNAILKVKNCQSGYSILSKLFRIHMFDFDLFDLS